MILEKISGRSKIQAREISLFQAWLESLAPSRRHFKLLSSKQIAQECFPRREFVCTRRRLLSCPHDSMEKRNDQIGALEK